jgi:hypothetical protein
MEILSIKEQLKKVNFRNYFIYQVEPEFKELLYGFSIIRNSHIEFIDINKEECNTVLKLHYSDIDKIYIKNILLDIYMKNGVIYHFKEIRLDLNEILLDFKGSELVIYNQNGVNVVQDYKVILEDNILSIVGNELDEYKDSISSVKYNINYNDIVGINEEYTYDKYRQVDVRTKNDNILICCD